MSHAGRHSGVKLQLAVHGDLGHSSLGLLAGVAHLVHVLALAGAEGGVAQESNLGVNAEDLGALGSLHGDLNQLVLVGLDVDGAVAHSQHVVVAGGGRTNQDEAGGDDLVAGLGLDQLQSGTDGVGGGVGSAAQQSVGLTHSHQHGAEVVALLQSSAALFLGHLALAQLDHLGNHSVHVLVGLGVYDDGAADVEAGVLSGSADFLFLTHQHGGQESTGQQTGRGLQNTGIGALGEYDLTGMSLQDVDEFLEHVNHSFQNRNLGAGDEKKRLTSCTLFWDYGSIFPWKMQELLHFHFAGFLEKDTKKPTKI